MELVLCRVVASFICKLTISLRPCFRMIFHIIRPGRNTKILTVLKLFSSTCNNLDSNIDSLKSTSLSSNFHIRTNFRFFEPIFRHHHANIKTIFHRDLRKSIHNLEFSPSQVLKGFSQIAFLARVLTEDDRTVS